MIYGQTVLTKISSVVEPLERYGWKVKVSTFEVKKIDSNEAILKVRLNVDHVASVSRNFTCQNNGGMEWLVKNTIDSKEFVVVRQAVSEGIQPSISAIRRELLWYQFTDEEVAEFANQGRIERVYSPVEAKWLAEGGSPSTGFRPCIKGTRLFCATHLDGDFPLLDRFISARMSSVDANANALW